MTYASSTCQQLGVPLETLSLQKEYWEQVVQYTFAEARAGRTPNPDIMCNSRVKFGMFYQNMGKHFSKVATGHYAQLGVGDVATGKLKELREVHGIEFQQNDARGRDDPPPSILFRSPDAVKDQTYFLCNLQQQQLQHALFPIGHLAKPSVRQMAEAASLPTQHRKDSQGICFLGKLKFDEFLCHYLGERQGEIRDYRTDQILGTHRGLWYHTVGQRKGIGECLVRGVVNAGPWFVASKDPVKNIVYITNDLTVIDRPRRVFTVQSVNWILGVPIGLEMGGSGVTVDVRLRHGPSLSTGRVVRVSSQEMGLSAPLSEDTAGHGMETYMETYRVTLSARDKGLAPGQFAAFYAGDVCLGAGVIAEAGRDE